MQKSSAYRHLIKQLNAFGSNKKDGYYPRIIELRKKFNQYHLWEVKWKYRLGCGNKPSHGVFYGSEFPTEYDTLIDEYFDLS